MRGGMPNLAFVRPEALNEEMLRPVQKATLSKNAS